MDTARENLLKTMAEVSADREELGLTEDLEGRVKDKARVLHRELKRFPDLLREAPIRRALLNMEKGFADAYVGIDRGGPAWARLDRIHMMLNGEGLEYTPEERRAKIARFHEEHGGRDATRDTSPVPDIPHPSPNLQLWMQRIKQGGGVRLNEYWPSHFPILPRIEWARYGGDTHEANTSFLQSYALGLMSDIRTYGRPRHECPVDFDTLVAELRYLEANHSEVFRHPYAKRVLLNTNAAIVRRK